MKNIILAFIFLPTFSFAAETFPFKTSELIEYTAKSELKFLDFGKTQAFQGLIRREHSASDLKHLDYYAFPSFDGQAVSNQFCVQILEKIFGKLSDIALKSSSLQISNAHSGKICEMQMLDPDKEAKIPLRRVIVGSVNATAIAFVMQLHKKENALAGQESLRRFWGTLR